ncbi:MAG TPA: radical SAM protein, partial [Deferrisomatales bacterium]|nr:radical SAM protein [Deferrisomatales bacterium]
AAYREQQSGGWASAEKALSHLDGRVKRQLATGDPDTELDQWLDALLAPVLAEDPELVGFSLFSLAQLPWAVALAQRLRSTGAGRPRTLVFGGAACSALRVDDLLEACGFLDGVVVGEGEAALLALCRCTDPGAVPGLVSRANGVLHRTRAQRACEPWAYPSPDFSALPLERYFNPSPVLPVLYSRSCKWRRCRFCAHCSSFGRYGAKAPEALVDELQALGARHGARHFYFADLFVDAPDLEALADAILRRGLDVRFQVLGRPVAGYTPQRLEKLVAAGCRWISWGVESGSQRLLDIAGKGTTVPVVERVLGNAHRAGISNLMMMIYGLPTSTDEDLDETFAFIERVYPWVDAMTASPFALFGGTPFARRAEHFGLVVTGADEELRVAGVPVRSTRLHFGERSTDGGLRPSRGAVEVGMWQGRRRWLGQIPFLEGVACEHYLLHVASRLTGRQTPPMEPPRRAA